MELSHNTKKFLKMLPASYFMLIALAVGIEDIRHPHTLRIVDIVLIALFATPVFFRRRMVYIVCGGLYALVWGYILFSVLVRYIAYLKGTHFEDPRFFFGIGFPLSIVSFMFSFALIIMGIVIGPRKP